VFLPASQVDIRRPGEISDWIGRTIEAVILKIDEERRNIVISRRKLIEQQREEMKRKTLDSLSSSAVFTSMAKHCRAAAVVLMRRYCPSWGWLKTHRLMARVVQLLLNPSPSRTRRSDSSRRMTLFSVLPDPIRPMRQILPLSEPKPAPISMLCSLAGANALARRRSRPGCGRR
jgi:hypothetical protein